MKILRYKRTFRKEFRRQIRLAIIAAIGFTVAFAWRNAVYDGLYEFVSRFAQSTQTLLTEVYTALFITALGVAVIFITARLLRD